MQSENNENKKVSIPYKLANLSLSDLQTRDAFGRTILHILVLSNRYDLLRSLFKNPAVKQIINSLDFENGWNCLHYIFFYKRLACFKSLLDYLKTLENNVQTNSYLLELISTKDRNRQTPFQLISNNLKDLVWIPEYIDEKNHIHLQYRYGGTEVATRARRNTSDLKNWWHESRCGSDIYMFGSNANNHLGVGDSSDRANPSRLSRETFALNNNNISRIQESLLSPRFNKVKISKNHSAILTQDGDIYTCGVGSRGRLGHGLSDLNNYYKFQKVELVNSNSGSNESSKTVFVKDVSISYNHTVLLTNNNSLYSWGLNDFNQLGFTSTYQNNLAPKSKTVVDTFEAEPREIVYGDLKKNSHEIKGIATSNIHSVAFTKHDLYFWGLNIGQMGIEFQGKETVDHRVSNTNYKGEIQSSPKLVHLRDEIKLVDACDTCTCVVTKSNDIHVFFRSQHLKLSKIPAKSVRNNHFDIFQPISLTRAISIEKICLRSHEFVGLLLDNGDIMSFSLPQDDIRNVKYSSIWKSYDKDMNAIDMDVGVNGSIILCTRNGSVFMKSNYSTLRKNSIIDSSMPTIKNKFKKVDHINKAARVSCDEKFLSFGVIRDEIDLIPLKLYTNDFLTDMQHLTVLSDFEANRKQGELLETAIESNTYVTDFIYNTKSVNLDTITWHEEEEEEETLEKDSLDISVLDRLLESHNARFTKEHKPVKNLYLYKPLREDLIKGLVEVLKLTDDEVLKRCTELSNSCHKNYDSFIEITSIPQLKIGFHKAIFQSRSRIFKLIFEMKLDEFFIDEGIELKFDNAKNILTFTTPVQPKALLILIYYLYTNTIIELWDHYPSGANCPLHIKETKAGFYKLLRIFKVSDIYTNTPTNKLFIKQMNSVLDSFSGDVNIRTSDGDIKCHSWILISRSAYFETILSNRWENSELNINFDFLSENQVVVILRHLYGFPDMDLFNSMDYSYADSDSFINELLELIEIADAFLLFQLKSICELAIKDLITLDNVLVLLVHADNLSAKKLFLNCSWFIYNNLEILIFDSAFKDLQYDLLKSLEKQVLYFQNCKKKDFLKDGVPDDGKMSNYFESKSNGLVSDFLLDINEFNDHFNSDKKGFLSFEPLVDYKYIPKQEGKKKRDRKASRKSSITPNDILNFRNNLQSKEKVLSELAIENIAEDDFKVVLSKKRNSKGSIPCISQVTDLPQSNGALLNAKVPFNRTPSPVDSDETKQPNVLKNNNQLLVNNILNSSQPVLSRGQTTASDMKKSSKIKFLAPTRLSQKERKKKKSTSSTPQVEDNAISQQAPWSVANSSSSSVNTINASKNDFPILGSSKNLDIEGNISHTPSLTEIMIEESLRIEDAKVRDEQRKTLQEIQQEQEFAKWWEEESLKVQKQLGGFSLGDGSSQESTIKKLKPPKHKQRGFSKQNKNTPIKKVDKT